MAKELISIVEGAQVRFQHQQRLLHQAQPALAGGCAEGAGPGYQSPADGVVGVLHQPFVFQAPDVFGEAGSSTMCRFFKILLVVAMPEFPLWVSDPDIYIYIYTCSLFMFIVHCSCSLFIVPTVLLSSLMIFFVLERFENLYL